MAYRAQFEQWIPVQLEPVFEFFTDLSNLPRIMPPWLDVRIEPPSARPAVDRARAPGTRFTGAGLCFIGSFRALPFLPFRIRSHAQIVHFVRNDYFEDVQIQGPFRNWSHRHEFAAESRNGAPGTRLRDIVEYEVGFEPLGGVINRLFIAPQIRRTFTYRQRAVERIFVSGR